MSAAQANYALKLLLEASAPHATVILSPFSIASALAIAYLGADGNTKNELQNLLAKGNCYIYFHPVVTQSSCRN